MISLKPLTVAKAMSGLNQSKAINFLWSQALVDIAIADLIRDKGETLELYCSLPEDEAKFMYLFSEHPNIV